MVQLSDFQQIFFEKGASMVQRDFQNKIFYVLLREVWVKIFLEFSLFLVSLVFFSLFWYIDYLNEFLFWPVPSDGLLYLDIVFCSHLWR